MLVLKDLINQGASRACYLHPKDDAKCVKVALIPGREIENMRREIKAYNSVRSVIGDYLVAHEECLVETNLGKGVVCDLLIDDDGEYSRDFHHYQKNGLLTDEILGQLHDFFASLLKNNIFFYDFNYKNFLVWCRNGRKYLKYADMKSYNNSRTLIKVEKFVPMVAKYKMKRRIIRFYSQRKLQYPESLSAL